jgi:predicted DCC family thiol-disulfide oxidoreductase YuxK
MPEPTRVAARPSRPLLLFDGNCGFCRRWIARWKSETGPSVEYAPSQEASGRFPEIPPEAFARSVQLVLPSGEVFEGARAVFRALEEASGRRWLLAAYEHLPGFAGVSELAYRLVARHRPSASAATRIFWGSRVEKPCYRVSIDLFLRAIGLCYLIAFLSLWLQVAGLIGSRGILPVSEFLDAVRRQTGGARFDLLPTLCWLGASDGFLNLLCGAGAGAALVAALGLAPAASLLVCWALYLSLSVAGQVFYQFQWDSLLLEAGFLAIFLAPPGWRLSRAKASPSPVMRLLVLWLLFRLTFASGYVKLASGDPAWRSLSALRYHYETQPLPPWTAWFAHQLPGWFQTLSCVVMFGIELGAPFLIFAPRRLRLSACGALVFLQIAIAATGNYAFFNLLTVALALPLLDDSVFPARWRQAPAQTPPRTRRRWPRPIVALVAGVVLLVSGAQTIAMVLRPSSFPVPVVWVARAIAPFRSVNTYGLFAVMTTSRPEIVLEGSDDSKVWRAYAFRWKPGDPARRPRFVAPYQPRLDWQMWFAALGSAEGNPWILRLAGRLLEGSPDVLELLARNPFPEHPPRYLRAVLYDYRFTDFRERRATGAWWKREETGLYLPVLSREMLGLGATGGLDPEPLGFPFQAELGRGRHVSDQRRRGDDGGRGEVPFAADSHPVLPVAVEGRDGALARGQGVGTLPEARPAPGLPDLSSDGAEDLRDRFARQPRVGTLDPRLHAT